MRVLGLRSPSLVALVGAVVLSVPLGGCGLLPGSDDDAVEAAADRLTEALADHSLEGVPLAGAGGAEAFAELVEPLKGYDVQVERTEIRREDDGPAVVPLQWEWQVEGHPWSYETEARLVEQDEEWVVEWQPDLLVPGLVEGERIDVDRTLPDRAEILGAGGGAIVTDRVVLRYGLDKTRLPAGATAEQVADSARRIAQALDIDRAAFVKAARAAGPKAFVEGVVLREEDAADVPAGYADIPGAVAIRGEMPLAPSREFAAPILGRVGPATAEIVEKSEGRVRAGDVVGLSGLQQRYDAQLAGTAGTTIEVEPAEGDPRELASWPAVPGRPLQLTLDVGLQEKAERVLAGTEGVSALVALRPSTGELLAAANGPGNDGLNAATFGQYAPGSTFKVVTSLALLRAGLQPGDTVDCPADTVVDGKRFKNYDDYPAGRLGRITLRTALANSCNTALIGERDRLAAGDLADAAAALGLGVDHDLGFPAYFGQVPPPASETEKAADMIGQGKVLASPMAMASVAASVAAGKVVVPQLVVGAEQPAGAAPAKPLTAAEAEALRGLMRAVVQEGSGRFLADLGQVGAKTGTAEYGEPGPGGALPTHAWMIATRGDLAVAVFVQDGVSGSQTAGPLLEAFLR